METTTATDKKKLTYSEKLRDPRWQKRRLEIMQRDKYACQHCHSTTNTLHVHHVHYNKGAMPWEYEDDMLMTLCEDCHNGLEEFNKYLLYQVAKYRSIREGVCRMAYAMDVHTPWVNPSIYFFVEAVDTLIKSTIRIQSGKLDDEADKEWRETFKESVRIMVTRLEEIDATNKANER